MKRKSNDQPVVEDKAQKQFANLNADMDPPKVVLNIIKGTKERCCKLTINKPESQHAKEIETPACIVYSRMGSPPCLPPDLLSKLDEIKVIQVGLHDLYSEAKTFTNFPGGLHKLLCLEDKILFLSTRDIAEYLENPISEATATINTKSGISKISPEEYSNFQKSIRPDIFEALSVDVPFSISTKRIRKSVEATLKWLDKCLEVNPKCKSNLFGVIQGGNSTLLRSKSLKETVKRDLAAEGYTLGGFGLGETSEQRNGMIKQLISELPVDKPRLVPGIGYPNEVLECVELGVDLFCTLYPNQMSDAYCALTFDIYPSDSKRNVYRLDLKDPKYLLDNSPIMKSCDCFACKNHTRAYIHHLFNTRELLAPILLTLHNNKHYFDFFKEIRAQILKGKFAEYKKWFLEVEIIKLTEADLNAGKPKEKEKGKEEEAD